MVFIRKKLIIEEDDTNTEEIETDGTIEDNDTVSDDDSGGSEVSSDSGGDEAPDSGDEGGSDSEISGDEGDSIEAEASGDEGGEGEDTGSLDSAIGTMGESEERHYNWHDILEILSDYVNPDVAQQIEDDWYFNYPDGIMDQEYVDDLLSDLAVSFNEEIADEIKSKIENLQDPKAVAALDLSTDIGVLQDALDKIVDPEIKEKVINLIDSLK